MALIIVPVFWHLPLDLNRGANPVRARRRAGHSLPITVLERWATYFQFDLNVVPGPSFMLRKRIEWTSNEPQTLSKMRNNAYHVAVESQFGGEDRPQIHLLDSSLAGWSLLQRLLTFTIPGVRNCLYYVFELRMRRIESVLTRSLEDSTDTTSPLSYSIFLALHRSFIGCWRVLGHFREQQWIYIYRKISALSFWTDFLRLAWLLSQFLAWNTRALKVASLHRKMN